MRPSTLPMLGVVVPVLLLWVSGGRGQEPLGEGRGFKEKKDKGPADEEREIFKEIKEAYKAPFEVHEEVLKELRKSYEQPSPDREAKIFKELHRLYRFTPDQELAVLREIRLAYEQPSAAQEQRIFQTIDKASRLPTGTVPESVQAKQIQKLFQRLDRNGDGLLDAEEMPEALRNERSRWDTNRDGFISPEEYAAYYQRRLHWLSDQVASGQIQLNLPKAATAGLIPPPAEEARPAEPRDRKPPTGLPDWFVKLDTDHDGQLGLYEWKKSGRPLAEFVRMDRNNDGFLTANEVLRYLAQQPQSRPDGLVRSVPVTEGGSAWAAQGGVPEDSPGTPLGGKIKAYKKDKDKKDKKDKKH
jgi:EF hand